MDSFINVINEDGAMCECMYWITKGRCFRKLRVNGVEGKTRRISENEYISAWECYNNY